jgi:small subunit ribosomal protein S16
MGSKRQPTYRIVVADKESPRDGAFIQIVGTYNPRTEPESYKIEEQPALHWLRVGAQPSEAVERLLKKNGTLERFERLKKGEDVAALVAEAAVAEAARPAGTPRGDGRPFRGGGPPSGDPRAGAQLRQTIEAVTSSSEASRRRTSLRPTTR